MSNPAPTPKAKKLQTQILLVRAGFGAGGYAAASVLGVKKPILKLAIAAGMAMYGPMLLWLVKGDQ